MPRGRLRDQAIFLSVVPLAFLVVLLAVSFVLDQYMQEAAWWSQHSALVLHASEDLNQALTDANDVTVRYAADRRAGELVEYRRASANVVRAAQRLQQLVSDNPEQSVRARTYVQLVLQGAALLDRYNAFVRAGNLRAARALDSAPSTRRLGSELAPARNAFDAHERDLAIARYGYLRGRAMLFGGVVIGITLLGIIVTLLTTARFGLHLAERLNQLAQNARRLGAGEDPPAMSGTDEVAQLDRVYQDMARTLRRERRVARTLQRALLPQRLPVIEGLEISSVYSPATGGSDIGGDWYDAFMIDAERIALSVGDVAGSGLLAATVMGGARQAIRTAARENADPAHVMRVTNRNLCAEGWLASAFYAVLDLGNGTIRYANAGHPPPYIAAAQTTRPLECEGLLLGVDDDAAFGVCTEALEERSLLVLYTDGLVEAERDLLGGMEKLRAILTDPAIAGLKSPARAIRAQMFERVHARDDAAILTLRLVSLAHSRNGTATWSFDARDADAAHRVKAEAVKFVTGNALDGDFTSVELIFSELAGNVARHTPGPAELKIERREGAIVIEMSDAGDPFTYMRPDQIDPFAESGRGLFLVHSLARNVRIDRGATGNRVRVALSN